MLRERRKAKFRGGGVCRDRACGSPLHHAIKAGAGAIRRGGYMHAARHLLVQVLVNVSTIKGWCTSRYV
jgi:hypothetical protein